MMNLIWCAVLLSFSIIPGLAQVAPNQNATEFVSRDLQTAEFDTVHGALSKVLKEKGEFESAEAFGQRMCGLSNVDLFNGLTIHDEMVLRIKLAGDSFSSGYDAHKSVYHLKFRTQNVVGKFLTGKRASYLAINFKDPEVVTKTANESVTLFRRIALTNINKLTKKPVDLQLDIPLDPNKARKAKGSLEFLYRILLREPYAFLDVSTESRVVPISVSRSTVLVAEVKEITVFDSETRVIYARIKPGH